MPITHFSRVSRYLWYFTEITNAKIWKRKQGRREVALRVEREKNFITLHTDLTEFSTFIIEDIDSDELVAYTADRKFKLSITKAEEIPATLSISEEENDRFQNVYNGRILEYKWRDPNALSEETYKAMREVGDERRKAYKQLLNSTQEDEDEDDE